jgi:hypothetical protein
MTKILTAFLATFALVAAAGTADANQRHKQSKKHMNHMQMQSQHGGWHHGWGHSSYSFKGDRYDFSQAENSYAERRDPRSWSNPMNAWDKARVDDAQHLRR